MSASPARITATPELFIVTEINGNRVAYTLDDARLLHAQLGNALGAIEANTDAQPADQSAGESQPPTG